MAESDRKKSRGKQPISRHPLFPVTVALWCGALLGLASFAIKPAAIEAVVLALHLDALVPAAAPPIGSTARILVALLLAALGAVAGLVASRRLADPRPAPGAASADKTVDAAATEGSALWMDLQNQRRELAAAQEQASTDPEPELAPEPEPRLPLSDEDEAQLLATAITDMKSPEVPADVTIPLAASETAPLSATAVEDADDAPELELAEEPQLTDHGATPAIEPESVAEDSFPAESQSEVSADPAVSAEAPPLAVLQMGLAAERITSADLDELSHLELLERLALSLQRRRAPVDEGAEPAVVFPGQAERRSAHLAVPPTGEPTAPTAPAIAAPGAAPQRAVETEQALRSALAALQRLSGAA